jgi:hypothetical protein
MYSFSHYVKLFEFNDIFLQLYGRKLSLLLRPPQDFIRFATADSSLENQNQNTRDGYANEKPMLVLNAFLKLVNFVLKHCLVPSVSGGLIACIEDYSLRATSSLSMKKIYRPYGYAH